MYYYVHIMCTYYAPQYSDSSNTSYATLLQQSIVNWNYVNLTIATKDNSAKLLHHTSWQKLIYVALNHDITICDILPEELFHDLYFTRM